MGEFAADFTNDLSFFEQVLFQRGKVYIDGEFNDAQRIPRVRALRLGMLEKNDRFEQVDTAGAVAARPVVKGLRFVNNGGDLTELRLEAATDERVMISCLGYVFELPVPIVIETATNVNAIPEWQQIYLTITEVEANSGGFPAIKLSALQETAIRTHLDVDVKVGAAQVQAANADCTVAQPWEEGTRTALLAIVRRDANSEGTQINPSRDIHEAWIDPLELREWQASFFSPQVRLRSSFHVPAVSAAASWKNSQLVIEELTVGVGFHSQNDEREFMNVRFVGKHLIDMNVGQTLVLLIPSRKAGFDAWNFATFKNEFNAVLAGSGSVRPSPQQIEYVVLDTHTLSDANEMTLNATRSDGDLFTRVPVCMRHSNPPTHSSGSTWEVDVVFIDGKHITREDVDRPIDIPSQHQVRWTQGNAWHDVLPPEDDVPSQRNDKTPYFRGYAFPRKNSVKEVWSQCVRNVANDDTLEGSLVFMRTYIAHELTSQFQSEVYSFEGEIRTYNAAWNPATNQWVRDDPAEHSTMALNGVQRQPFSGAIHSVMGTATHIQTASSPWNNTAWDSGSDTSTAHSFFEGDGGGISLGTSNNNVVEVGILHRLRFSANTPPVKAGAADNFPQKSVHYDCMSLKAFGRIISLKGVGGEVPAAITIQDGSMNISSAAYSVVLTEGLLTVTMNHAMAGGYFVNADMVESQYNNDITNDNKYPIQIAQVKPINSTQFRIKLSTQYPTYTGGASGDVSQGLWEDFTIDLQFAVFGAQ